MTHGIPEYIRSDNGPEFVAKELKKWCIATKAGVKTLYIEPGSPWENGYCESFNGKMTKYLTIENGRNEFLSMELFDTMYEIEVLIACMPVVQRCGLSIIILLDHTLLLEENLD